MSNQQIREQAEQLYKNNSKIFKALIPRAPRKMLLTAICSILSHVKNSIPDLDLTNMTNDAQLYSHNTTRIKEENNKFYLKKEFLDNDFRAQVEFCLSALESPMHSSSEETTGTNAEIVEYSTASEQDKSLIRAVNPFTSEEQYPISIKLHSPAGLTDIRKNLEDYPEAKFIKNSLLPQPYRSTSMPGLQTITIQVIDEIYEDTKFIISRKHLCSRCKNYIEVSSTEYLSKARIACRFLDSTGEECGEALSLTQYKFFEPCKFKKLFKYKVMMTEHGENEFEQEKQFTALSFAKLNVGNNVVDMVPGEIENLIYVLAKTYPEQEILFTKEELDSQPIPEHLNNTMLHKLNYMIKKIHKNIFNMDITNTGELMQVHRIIQSLSREWFNYRSYNIYGGGDPSTGKTMPAAATAEMLSEFSFISKESSDATRPALIANMSTNPPTPGLLARFDDVVLDEIGAALTVDPKTGEVKSEIPGIILGFGLAEEIERVTGTVFRSKKRGSLTMFSNMNLSHQAHRLNLRRTIYIDLVTKAGKANDPTYEYVSEWPKIISNISYFEVITGNEFIGKAEKATNSYFEQKGIHPAIGMQIPALHRCTFNCFVDSYEAFAPEMSTSEMDIRQLVALTKRNKLYYRYRRTMNELFPMIKFTPEVVLELQRFILRMFVKYPNMTIEKNSLFNAREVDLYMIPLKVLMRLHQTAKLIYEVEQDFETLFKYKGMVINRFQYNLEEKRDMVFKKKMLTVMEAIEYKNFDLLEELIIGKKKETSQPRDDAPSELEVEEYNSILNMLLKAKELEHWNAENPLHGYVLTEKGKFRMKELGEEEEKIKKNLDDYVQKSKQMKKQSSNPFEGLEGM